MCKPFVCWCLGSARALVYVLLHGGLVCAAADALLEGGDIQPHVLGRGLELRRTGLRGMGEECVVIR